MAGLLQGRWSCVSSFRVTGCSHSLSNGDSGTEALKSKLAGFPLPPQEIQTVELGQKPLRKVGDRNDDFQLPLEDIPTRKAFPEESLVWEHGLGLLPVTMWLALPTLPSSGLLEAP